jgi:hypothetical protein
MAVENKENVLVLAQIPNQGGAGDLAKPFYLAMGKAHGFEI